MDNNNHGSNDVADRGTPVSGDNPTISYEEYQKKAKNLKTMSDVTAFAKSLIAPTLQRMLDAEMDEHLGYKKHELLGHNTGNSRNGSSPKKLRTSFGTETLSVPRDRKSNFEPLAVRKYETIESDVEERIIAMYAKGMTTRDITQYMQDIYGIEVSAGMISSITDKVMPLIEEWQSRPLAPTYPFVYLDGMYCKVRDSGRIVNRSAYIVVGIDTDGMKDILGIWIGQSEGAKFWMSVLTELKNRGIQDILIASIDGLSGFSEAIKAVFPDTDIQQCIVHQLRNTMKYVPHKHKKQFVTDLRSIYTAPTEEAGLKALESVKDAWPQYKAYLTSWETKWAELSPFFQYPAPIRRMMYTTNTIEAVNRQFRKVTKTTTVFPHNEALLKLLWLAQNDITRKWSMPVRNWAEVISQLAILFPEKIKI
jgi:putative transposase